MGILFGFVWKSIYYFSVTNILCALKYIDFQDHIVYIKSIFNSNLFPIPLKWYELSNNFQLFKTKEI